MTRHPCRTPALAAAVLLAAALWAPAHQPAPRPLALEDLKHMSFDELLALYKASDVGRPFVGDFKGGLVHVTDRHLPRIKLRLANTFWRGKEAHDDGYFVNRWIGGIKAIDSTYVIGPSWLDGRPAVLMDYAPRTPLFGNLHDELREVAPGVYLGPVFQRCPCPLLRGFVAVEQKGSCGCSCRR
jgi:hypothetical protein